MGILPGMLMDINVVKDHQLAPCITDRNIFLLVRTALGPIGSEWQLVVPPSLLESVERRRIKQGKAK